MICPYCGTDLTLELEVWGHDWWPTFCCEQLENEWQDNFAHPHLLIDVIKRQAGTL